jgi:hypothetical protein
VLTRSSGAPAPILILAALLLAGGCGKDDVARTFAGGSHSSDKEPIPAAVQAAPTTSVAQPEAPAQAAPAAVTEPVAASKLESADLVDGTPIRAAEGRYRSDSQRDPFRSLISADADRTDVVDLSVVKLVGIVMGETPFATVEDAERTAYVLRKGDRVKNGRIVSIDKGRIVASQTLLGYTTTVQLKLQEEMANGKARK